MKIKTKDLLFVLKSLKGVVPTRSTIPILENICIVKKDTWMVIGSDMYQYMGINIDVENGFECCIPYERLYKTISMLTEPIVEFILDGNSVSMKAGRSSFTLPVMDFNDFLMMPSLEYSEKVIVDRDSFFSSLSLTSPFIASDDFRPIMSSINLRFMIGKLEVIGTNAHVLMRTSFDIDNDSIFNVSISGNVARANVAFSDDKITLYVTEKNFGIQGNGVIYFIRLTEGSMPNFDAVWPHEDIICTSTVNADDFLSIINQVSLYSSKITGLVKVSFGERLYVEGVDVDFSLSASAVCECDGEGFLEVGLNSSFLSAILSAVKNKKIQFNAVAKQKAVVFNTDICDGLIMPMLYD